MLTEWVNGNYTSNAENEFIVCNFWKNIQLFQQNLIKLLIIVLSSFPDIKTYEKRKKS